MLRYNIKRENEDKNMIAISSLRSDIFQKLLSLQSEIKDFEKQIERLIKKGGEITQYFAYRTAPLMSNAARSVATIIRCRLGDAETLLFLKEAALTLNRIVSRCADYAPTLATKVCLFYQKLVGMFPQGTTLQLELLGQGDYRRELEPPPLMLTTIATWWRTHGRHSRSPQPTRVQQHEQPVQLCLNFQGCAS